MAGMANTDQVTPLCADVAPFIPSQRDVEGSHLGVVTSHSISPTPLPRYLTTCFPFVQEGERPHFPSEQHTYIPPTSALAFPPQHLPPAAHSHPFPLLSSPQSLYPFFAPSLPSSIPIAPLFHYPCLTFPEAQFLPLGFAPTPPVSVAPLAPLLPSISPFAVSRVATQPQLSQTLRDADLGLGRVGDCVGSDGDGWRGGDAVMRGPGRMAEMLHPPTRTGMPSGRVQQMDASMQTDIPDACGWQMDLKQTGRGYPLSAAAPPRPLSFLSPTTDGARPVGRVRPAMAARRENTHVAQRASITSFEAGQTPGDRGARAGRKVRVHRRKAEAATAAALKEYSILIAEHKRLEEALQRVGIGEVVARANGPTIQGTDFSQNRDVAPVLAAIKKQQEGVRPHIAADAILHRSERTTMVGQETSNDFSSCNGIVEKDTSPQQQQFNEQKSLMEDQLVESEALKQEDGLILHNLHPSSLLSQDELSPASQASLQSVGSLSPPSPPSPPLGHRHQPPPSLHSQRYREYCCQLLSVHIDECVSLLLQQLMQLQEEVSAAAGRGGRGGPAGSGRRLVMGLREVTKHLRLGRLEGLIISPNCDSSQGKGGLDEALQTALALAGAQGILVCFALGRKALGRCVNKLVPVSAVGIFSYAGAEALFHRLTRLTLDARQAYQAVVSALQHADEVSRPSGDRSPRPSEEQATAAGRLPFMTHSRNVSAASAVSFCSALSEPISEVNERDAHGATSLRCLILGWPVPVCHGQLVICLLPNREMLHQMNMAVALLILYLKNLSLRKLKMKMSMIMMRMVM
uniref:selenocysteine insertion sequence-binding protein 2-like isoform X2 n=1 Tax=Myxine glutinosa TaxID=7769 RepID=UPI00358EDBF4